MMLLPIGGRMFRVRAFKAEADDANTLRLRHLHSLFFDDDDSNNRAHSDLMSNSTADFTSDHYYPPAADGVGGPSITSNTYTMSSAPTNQTQANNSIDELSENSHHDHYNQGLSFTLIFLALMIVYIALFCIQFRREASTTAANDVNEQRKLEERKKRIGEALVSRLIVEDADEEDIKVDLEKGEDTRANAESDFHDSGEDGEENQVVNDEDQGHYDDEDEEMGMKEAAAEEKTRAQEDDAASNALAKQQDETLSTSTEETTVATSSSSSGERTIDTIPSISNEVVPTIDTSSSSSTSMLAVSSSSSPPPPPPPPPSPFRKYADALFCKKCHTQNSDASNNNNTSPGNESSSDSPSSLPTITLSTIQQTYGEEECIICFSNFQVGDLVALSKHQINVNGCTHVFHDDCLTRWLLVRDCCPMCRRSYGVVG